MIEVLYILLGVSVVGLLLLLLLKQFELSTGAVILGPARPAVGRFFHKGLVWFERTLPSFVVGMGRWVYQSTKGWLQQGIARSILWFETTLESLLHTVKEKTQAPRGQGQVSAFLREIADHKHKLSKELKGEDRAIFDEQ